MCGRYFVDNEIMKEVRRRVSLLESEPDMRRRDICPSEQALVLVGRERELSAEMMCWGFPHRSGKGLLINARAESALDKPMFSDSLLRRRCVIPAGGFYEWSPWKERASFYREDAPALYMAGFYCPFSEQNRFVILTTKANASVAPVHDRMPLLLEECELEDWIFGEAFMKQVLKKTPAPLARQQEYEQQRLTFV